jgi:hypothetical protein
MNEFASALSTALHQEAQEIAMSADMQHAERQLQESIRSVDRRRRVWIAVAAAAALLVVAAGITLGVRLPNSGPAHPNPSPSVTLTRPIPYNQLTPSLTVQLPRWIASHGANDLIFSHGFGYAQPNGGRAVRLFSVSYMYPLGAATITQPTYTALVYDWKAIQSHGYGTVNDVATTTVDRRPATTMTIRLTRQVDGFVYCEAATSVRNDGNACLGIFPGRTYHLAIVDNGATLPPSLFWESSATDYTQSVNAAVASEFAAWLATVHFQ